ncbi:UbiD family decarboxylase associated with menaquinone via futalosine [Helicobacter heilmannii]|uniref:menaquinone biosynthesis decarboxylase n=1 Tax=Helicobacter heilmannii TaxID=35817 RepID=UPI0006A18EE8|nr:menaquinone biosynthesis decarboxylase [Helicobacter heilmannii]CRF48063.1 UbiD family decarboxylase associated with menaquinone via futalosine [Helicobacter heilmannii]
MQELIAKLKERGDLCVLDTPLDICLEIPHIAYIEAKKPRGGQALLFTRPKRGDTPINIPVLMNVFGAKERLEFVINRSIEDCQAQLESLLNLQKPKSFKDFLGLAKNLCNLRFSLPKISKTPPKRQVFKDDRVDLNKLPILTTWEHDAAPFITMGQIYTKSLDNKHHNLGLYRLQVQGKNRLSLHWQIHKDANHFFHAYKEAGVKMPVSVAIGGDALYAWCGQAPLPYGVFELALYGLIRGKCAQLMPCLTNPLAVPLDADIVLEGWVDTSRLEMEGPFGDHTGFYTPKEPYPVLEVQAMHLKDKPVYLASVVGKPPLEDKYMGYFTERLFLPLLKKSAHGLVDYHMPENGVFHNLILAQIAPSYPGHAHQIMHHFWGAGQMSFVKHAIFVGKDTPKLTNYPALFTHILDHLDLHQSLFSQGVCDALDHASPNYAFGGKLGLVALEPTPHPKTPLRDLELLARLQDLMPQVQNLRQYGLESKNPIAVVGVEKTTPLVLLFKDLEPLAPHVSALIFVDNHKNDLNNPYMLLWRVTNNIDAQRDIWLKPPLICIDATDKGALEGHTREWPKETDCTLSVLESLANKGLIPPLSDPLYEKYHIHHSPKG